MRAALEAGALRIVASFSLSSASCSALASVHAAGSLGRALGPAGDGNQTDDANSVVGDGGLRRRWRVFSLFRAALSRSGLRERARGLVTFFRGGERELLQGCRWRRSFASLSFWPFAAGSSSAAGQRRART